MRRLLAVIAIISVAWISGCSVQSKPTMSISALETNESVQDLYPDVGILYDYFYEFNTWSPDEEERVQSAYQGMIRAIEKLKRKTIAGKTDYHRLLYFNEDMTEYWEVLREMLNAQTDLELLHENKHALALYRRVRADVDAILMRNNIRLQQTVDQMNAETYDAIRGDAIKMIKTMTPLFQKGAAFLL